MNSSTAQWDTAHLCLQGFLTNEENSPGGDSWFYVTQPSN